MDKAIYIASNGAKQTMLAMQANNSNLANANTTGFKADLLRFNSVPVTGGRLPTRTYSLANEGGVNEAVGPTINTRRPLDIAIQGTKGWISVQVPGGGEAYTRAGNLQVSLNGTLMTANGNPVLGNKGPIAIPPNQRVEIGADGTVSILPIGATNNLMAVIDRIKLVAPPNSQLKKGADGLFHSINEEPVTADIKTRVIVGALEGSNVTSVDALVNMIDLSRHYETQVKLMKIVESNSSGSESIIKF